MEKGRDRNWEADTHDVELEATIIHTVQSFCIVILSDMPACTVMTTALRESVDRVLEAVTAVKPLAVLLWVKLGGS